MHPDFPGQRTHLEYRYYQDHVNNILKNPRHEASCMEIDIYKRNDENEIVLGNDNELLFRNDYELIQDCFHRLVYLPQPIEQKIPFKVKIIDTTFEEEDNEVYIEQPFVQNSPT